MTPRRYWLLYWGTVGLLLGSFTLAWRWHDAATVPPPVAAGGDDAPTAGDTNAALAGLPLPPLDGELY